MARDLSKEEIASRLARQQDEAIDSLYDSGEDYSDAYPPFDRSRTLEPVSPGAHTVTPVVQQPTDTVQGTLANSRKRIRHGVAAAVISVLVIFGIGYFAGSYTRHVESERETAAMLAENERRAAEAAAEQERVAKEAEEQLQQEKAHALRQLKFIVSASAYDSLATRIPMVITGTDLDGAEVQTEGFINYEGTGVALSPGSYTASIPASPVLANGGMYRVPDTTYSFKVPNDEQETIQIDQAIVLIPLNAAELTEDMINNSYSWGIKDAQFSSVVEANVAAARKVREEEVARKKAEERRKQMEEQRAPIAQSFAVDYFTNIGFPDDEDDSKVMVIANWSAVAGQYVASGSLAQGKIGSNPGTLYSFVTHASVASMSSENDSVTVDVRLVATNEIKNGWTLDSIDKRVTCVFDDNNMISDFTID